MVLLQGQEDKKVIQFSFCFSLHLCPQRQADNDIMIMTLLQLVVSWLSNDVTMLLSFPFILLLSFDIISPSHSGRKANWRTQVYPPVSSVGLAYQLAMKMVSNDQRWILEKNEQKYDCFGLIKAPQTLLNTPPLQGNVTDLEKYL